MRTRKGVAARITRAAKFESVEARNDLAATISALNGVTNEERHQLISQAAYFRAERRSFTPGYELEDWLNAEAEIDGLIRNA